MEECQCRTWNDLLPSKIEFGNVVEAVYRGTKLAV
jgi:hypothetical protein